MNTATLTGSLRDGIRDPKNTDKIFKQGLIPKEKAKQLFDRMGVRFGSIGLPPKQKPYTQPVELNLNQFGGKKKVSSNKMIRSQYAGRRRRPHRRLGARKRMAGGFFGKIFSGIKKAVEKVAPIVRAVQPVSRFGSMLGLPAPAVEVAKMVGVGRRRRRRVGARKVKLAGMAKRRRRVGGTRAGARRLMRLF